MELYQVRTAILVPKVLEAAMAATAVPAVVAAQKLVMAATVGMVVMVVPEAMGVPVETAIPQAD
jgi:hypothetical protein